MICCPLRSDASKDFVEHTFHHCMEATGADVFGALIDRHGDRCNLIDGIIGEGHLHPFSLQQCLVLLDQGILGLLENTDKIIPPEWVQFHTNGKRP